MAKVPKNYLKKCKKDPSWCSTFSKTVLKKMNNAQLLTLNCGKKPATICKNTKKKLDDLCKKEFPKKVNECIDAKIVMHSFIGCGGKAGGGGGQERAAKLGDDKSGGTELRLGIGAVLLIIIMSAIAAYCYFFGGKKDGKAAGKGAASKSKMAGKSKLGSRKSQASKRSSRKGSQRSKMSGASKGTKSRMSGKKK